MKSSLSVLLLVIGVAVYPTHSATPCNKRTFQHDSVVCVCDANFCDVLDPITRTPAGQAKIYESDRGGKRLEVRQEDFNRTILDPTTHTVTLDRNMRYQEIIGFGGSWSDAAAIGLNRLTPDLRTKALRSYFSDEGIEYSLARVVISGSDFSNRAYSYIDLPAGQEDWELNNWSLVDEDRDMKIPQMQEATRMQTTPLKFIGSSWSPPAWMKNNGELNHGGALKGRAGQYEWKQYARYLLKFFQSYNDAGLRFWGMTIQNEPLTGGDPWFPWNTCWFSSEDERDFAKLDLGPIMEEAGYPPSEFHIMTLDHNRPIVPDWSNIVFSDNEASKYIAGIAVHWYFYGTDGAGPYTVYDDFHNRFPDKFILATEACNRNEDDANDRIGLGKWVLAEDYAHDILLDLLHWVTGWTDWNLVLDMEGGPNWVNNVHSAPIIVNPQAGEFYKNVQYYAMAHFAKFLPPGSVRISLGAGVEQTGRLEIGAFERPDGGIVIIVINTLDIPQVFLLNDPVLGELKVKVDPHQFSTWVYYY